MSDPTYRIDLEDSPGNVVRWMATIVRLSDNEVMQYVGGDTSAEAAERAGQWIASYNVRQEPFSVYVDDDGQPVVAHSVKA